VVTLHIGEFLARETLLQCPTCGCCYTSEELSQLVAPGCNIGYDVLVYVGQALFLGHRNREETRDELIAKNVRISLSEIDYLGRKFITYLAIAHRQCSERIRQAIDSEGGYILHLDATAAGKQPLLMTGLDSITEIVLGNVKLSSENAQEIIPFLQEIQRYFGDPLACVHDMGKGILNAVEKVFPDASDFICHFHFLRDIGKDLLGQHYDTIRKRLRSLAITTTLRNHARKLKQVIDGKPDLVDRFFSTTQPDAVSDSVVECIPALAAYSLIVWILDGKNDGHGYGFPFDRSHLVFAQRLRAAYRKLDEIKTVYLRGDWHDNRPLFKLSCDLKPVFSDHLLQKAMTEIEPQINLFDQLRDAMRIAPTHGSQGLNCDPTQVVMATIEQAVTELREITVSDPAYCTNKPHQKMIAQIDKYWEKLFADPLQVHTPRGTISIQPQRTNNILERFFRDFKRGHRRKTGNHSMGKTFQSMLADTPLVKNLKNQRYMDILLHGKATLHQLFADIDAKTVRSQLQDNYDTSNRIPPKIKQLIAQPQFPEIITNIFRPGTQKT